MPLQGSWGWAVWGVWLASPKRFRILERLGVPAIGRPLIRGGKWGLCVGGGEVMWQVKTDPDGKTLVDDGRSTNIALLELLDEFENWAPRLVEGQEEEEWDHKLVEVFTSGLKGKVMTYLKDDSFKARCVYQAGRHHIDNNKVAHTSIAVLIEVAEYALDLHAKSSAKAAVYLMAQHGRGSKTQAMLWITAAQQIPKATLDALRSMDYLKPTYVMDNECFVTSAARAKDRLLSESYQQRALKLLQDEFAVKNKLTTTGAAFASTTCRALKAVQNMDLSAIRRFGEKIAGGKAKDNLIQSLCTVQGLKRVHGCLTAGIPLEGKSDQEVGIEDVRKLFAEFARCKAGGDAPQPTNNHGGSVEVGSQGVPGPSSSSFDVKDAMEFAALCTDEPVDGNAPRLSEEDLEHHRATETFLAGFHFHKDADDVRKAAVDDKNLRTLVLVDAPTSSKVTYANLLDLAYDIAKVNDDMSYATVLTSLRARYDLLGDVKCKAGEKFLEGAARPALCPTDA